MKESLKDNTKESTNFIRFIGGKSIFFLFALLSLIGLTIFIFNQISFVFYPLIVIVSTLLPPVILAFIAFHVLNPLVNLLEKIKINRLWGIIILILAITAILVTIIILTAPMIENQVSDLIEYFPEYMGILGTGMTDFAQNSFFANYYEEGYDWIVENFSDIPGIIGGYVADALHSVQNVASTLTNVVVTLVTFPVVLFFLLKDADKFKAFIIKLLPPAFRKDTKQIIHNVDTQVGSYIQGQILVATVMGVFFFIGYLIIGLPYAMTLAIVAAVTSVIPYLGATMAIIPALIIGIVQSPFMLIKVAIVWVLVQFIEGNLVSPNIMGKTLKVHPLTIIFVLLIAGNIFGFVGVILGIPGYAVLKVIAQYLYEKFKLRYNKFFGEEHGDYSDVKQ